MNNFFYRNWWLYYLLLFLLIGLLIYALLWRINFTPYHNQISSLNDQNTILKEHVQGKDNYIKQLENRLQECDKSLTQSPEAVQCNAIVESGGQGITETRHELGNTPGVITINYNTQTIPDKIEVFYNGNLVATTNQLVSGQGKLSFTYNAESNSPTECIVKVSAPENGTKWKYVVNCPQ